MGGRRTRPWPAGGLDSNGVENMIARVTGGRMLPAEVMKQIVTKTDGNPLFVEELTKTVLEAGFLVENGEGYRLDGPLPPLAVYSFKHALVRDAAYESLLKSRRQQLHGQIARTLEERFADILTSQPEIVAHHFTQAGLVDPAIDY